MASTSQPDAFGKPTHQTALVVLINEDAPDSLHEAVQGIRRVHDRHFKRWPPHITLAYPFAPHEDLEKAANALHEGLRDVRPFDLVFGRLGFFQHGPTSHTIWLAPQDIAGAAEEPSDPAKPPPHPELLGLQAACEAALPAFNEVRAKFGHFTPHLSIKQAKWANQVKSFIRDQQWTARTFPVTEVVILSRGPDTPFAPAYRISLAQAGPVVKEEETRPSPAKEEEEALAEGGGAAQGGGGRVEEPNPATTSSVPVEEAFDVDGSVMEGGGQILRVSIALATLLQKPLRISKIRAKRSRPGLQPQHLTGVRLVAELGHATLHNGHVHSTEIALEPQGVSGGHYTADPGTAGSITLLIQASLPCLPFARQADGTPEASRVTLRGGTTLPHAPPIDYFQLITLPLLRRMGLHAEAEVRRRGYYPQGGGHVELTVQPCDSLQPIELTECGVPVRLRAVVCGIVHEGGQTHAMADSMEGALKTAIRRRWDGGPRLEGGLARHVEVVRQEGAGQGGQSRNKRQRVRGKREVLHVLVVLETSTGCLLGADELVEDMRASDGDADAMAERIVDRLAAYVDAGACVDEHCMDQLVIFAALARGRSRVLGPPKHLITSLHLETAVHMAERLAGARFTITEQSEVGPLLLECEGIGYGR